VRGGLVTAPSHVDVVAVSVTLHDDELAVRIDVAAGLPTRKTGAEVQNLVFFADVDGDGEIDYEVLASLSDDGWFPSRRQPDGATYGAGSGVQVSVAGASLTLRFDTSGLGGARAFRWAVGSEWGTYEQVSTGTTAQDLAPDEGAADFPA
jgi:hypothetical protein